MRFSPFILLSLLVVACTDQDPVAPDMSPLFSAAAGMDKEAISGTIAAAGTEAQERSLITPSGMCHFWNLPNFTDFHGAVEGPVTFYEDQHFKCDFSTYHLVASGPVEGDVEWNGLEGNISGQWTTNCKPDDSQPLGLSCDGTMNLRGSGELEGVQFHMKWGPGWFPFDYTGTAFWK
jgi:hypothetical protein